MSEENNTIILDKKIEDWKNKLIDLSRKNRLLNFKPTKVSTIKIIDEIPSEVFKSMVIDNHPFRFLPKKTEDLFDQVQTQKEDELEVEFFEYDSQKLEEKHIDLNLQTNLPEEKLQKNLKTIHLKSNQIMEEQGYNTLYLTLGIIEWYEADQSDVKNRSPLIMLPVELKKRSIQSKYKLHKSDEEPFVNPALQHKLSTEFNTNIPDLLIEDDFSDPQEYLLKIKELIKATPRWKITNEIYLGLFSFAKFVMFKDLEKYNDNFKNNIIVQALAGIKRLGKNGHVSDYITADKLDEKRKPLDLFQVLDADSSQQEAIEAVKANNSIVIQGPPGTGKSQTITNLIAELIANGKKVLFVSEKMAALDVVYKRLQSVGLGEYSLEIHSRKANKRYVLEQLKDAYESKHPGNPKIDYKIEELQSYRKKLNEYSKTLHTPVESFGKSPYWFIGSLNQIKKIEILDINFSHLLDITFEQYESIINTIQILEERIKMIGHPHNHPFWGCEIETINEFEQQKLISQIKTIINELSELIGLVDEFSSEINIEIRNLSKSLSYCNLLTILAKDHKLPESLAKIDDLSMFFTNLNPILKDIDKYQEQNKKILKKYHKDVFKEEIKEIHKVLKTKLKSFWRIFSLEYYRIRKKIKSHLVYKNSIPYSDLLSDIEGISSNIELKKKIYSTSEIITNILSFLWKKTETQTKVVINEIEWLSKYRNSRLSKSDDDKLLDYIINSSSIPNSLLELKTVIENKTPHIINKIDNLNSSLKVNEQIIYSHGIEEVLLEDLYQKLKIWEANIDKIVDWTRYQKAFSRCKEVGLQQFFEEMFEQENQPNEFIKKFKKTFLFHLFQRIIEEKPSLKQFESLTQDNIVIKFQELDNYQLELAKIRIRVKLFENKPDSGWEGAKSSQLGYLQRQFRLKRGHHTVRKIFAKVPDIVQQLCPCFMMSPLSLSQYINPEVMKFDVVVFDEASQMSPVDSLGSIIRGDCLVCVGDTKQLPPTTYFDRVVQTEYDDNDLEDYSTPDLECILEECLAIGLKEFYLKWHYRSRHESLIHFSNKNFYKNELNTFPSPDIDSNNLGLSLIHIENSIYDRGGSQTNPKEAQEVANAVFDHFKTNSNRSLGVGTFSQAQQVAIYDELEILRRNDPSFEEFFSGDYEEPFFIKNLETIQGDERDVIFISVGYGRDSNGKLTMNFGPLNKPGGERRLNVLVTRAREKVVVFSSILGDDFDLSKTQALGVHKLKQYLDFAKSKGDKSLLDITPDLTTDYDESNIFEMNVYQQLKDKGIKVIPQVGYAGYKIDFGILHPDDPSKFILAVECDGANYHSSATARDRDRLRQQVLENLGWRFHRIWSTDWFLNPSREMTKLLQAIENAKSVPLNPHYKRNKPEINIEEIEPDELNNLEVEIVPYKKYLVSIIGLPENFYWLVKSTHRIENLIGEIIEVESPIHIKELSLRVIQHFDMGKVGSKILKIMDSLVFKLQKERKLKYINNFIYKSNQSCKKIRKRDNPEAISNIEFIPNDEIQNAILLVLKKEISIYREELIPKVAKVFGFQHTGKKIQNYINKQIATLLRNKNIIDSAYGLQLSS